jgi:type VI secretion system protein ImpA
MPAQPTLDIERLVAPISDENPAGTYLKETDYGRLQEVKDLRAQAVAAERKQRELLLFTEEDLEMIPEQDRRVAPPDWRSVRDRCTEILENHSKDLWVASWLVEANTRLAGFPGLRDAFRVIDEMVKQHWPNVFPPADDEEGFLGTVSQLTSLSGEEAPGALIAPIESISLIPGRDDLSLAAYRQATQGNGGDLVEADFRSAVRNCDTGLLQEQLDSLQEATAALRDMIQSLEERAGEHDGMPVAPSSSHIRKTLQDCREILVLLTDGVLESDDILATDEDSSQLIEAGGADGRRDGLPNDLTQVANREEAFRLLLRVSDFFRKTEPHSPISYMLQQAVDFGRMDLPELLKVLITDEDVLSRFAERTGIEIKNKGEE